MNTHDHLESALNVTQAAQFLGVSRLTIYDWVYQRKIPFRKHGRRLAFNLDDLRQWSERQAVAPFASGRYSSPPHHGKSVSPAHKTLQGKARSLKIRTTDSDCNAECASSSLFKT